MNKIKILILGFAAISAASLCSAYQAPPASVPIEKVVSFDTPAPSVSFDVAVCDIEYLKMSIAIEREAVSYAVRQSSTAGRDAEHAKVSAHGRTCGGACNCSLRSKPSTDYEQRM